jgi:hypothetical protein
MRSMRYLLLFSCLGVLMPHMIFSASQYVSAEILTDKENVARQDARRKAQKDIDKKIESRVAEKQAIGSVATESFHSFNRRMGYDEKSLNKLHDILLQYSDLVNERVMEIKLAKKLKASWFSRVEHFDEQNTGFVFVSIIAYALFYQPASLRIFYAWEQEQDFANKNLLFEISEAEKEVLQSHMQKGYFVAHALTESTRQSLLLDNWMQWQEIKKGLQGISVEKYKSRSEADLHATYQELTEKIEKCLSNDQNDLKEYIDFKLVQKHLDAKYQNVLDSFEKEILAVTQDKKDEIVEYLNKHSILLMSTIQGTSKEKDLINFLKSIGIRENRYESQTLIETILKAQEIKENRAKVLYEALPQSELLSVKSFLDAIQNGSEIEEEEKVKIEALLKKHKDNLATTEISFPVENSNVFGLLGSTQKMVSLPLIVYAFAFAPESINFLYEWGNKNKIYFEITPLAEAKVDQYIKDGILKAAVKKDILHHKKQYLVLTSKKDSYGDSQFINLEVAPLLRAHAYCKNQKIDDCLVDIRRNFNDETPEEILMSLLKTKVKRNFDSNKNKKNMLNTAMVVVPLSQEEDVWYGIRTQSHEVVIAIPLVLYAIILGKEAIEFLESFDDADFLLKVDVDASTVLLNMYEQYGVLSEATKNKFFKRLHLWVDKRKDKNNIYKSLEDLSKFDEKVSITESVVQGRLQAVEKVQVSRKIDFLRNKKNLLIEVLKQKLRSLRPVGS